MRKGDWGRIVGWGLLYGLFMSIVGVTGNRVLLRDQWDHLHEIMPVQFHWPYSRLWHEVISISFDFVDMVLLFWVFAHFARKTVWTAMQITIVWWLMTVAQLYLAMVNSGMMPWWLSLETSIVGLVSALPAAFLLPWVFRDRPSASA